jgi:hypothetical protein
LLIAQLRLQVYLRKDRADGHSTILFLNHFDATLESTNQAGLRDDKEQVYCRRRACARARQGKLAIGLNLLVEE